MSHHHTSSEGMVGYLGMQSCFRISTQSWEPSLSILCLQNKKRLDVGRLQRMASGFGNFTTTGLTNVSNGVEVGYSCCHVKNAIASMDITAGSCLGCLFIRLFDLVQYIISQQTSGFFHSIDCNIVTVVWWSFHFYYWWQISQKELRRCLTLSLLPIYLPLSSVRTEKLDFCRGTSPFSAPLPRKPSKHCSGKRAASFRHASLPVPYVCSAPLTPTCLRL